LALAADGKAFSGFLDGHGLKRFQIRFGLGDNFVNQARNYLSFY
jgi:hypothetical protein